MRSLTSDRTDVLVNGALDGLASRHRALVNNIANVDTPGFQPSDVKFEEELRRVQAELDGSPASEAAPQRSAFEPVPEEGADARQDGNGVQIDDEAMRLSENTLTYEALVQAARLRHDLLRSVIMEGRR